jgi:hypothetical protein
MQKCSIFVDSLFHKLLEHLLEICDLNVFLLNAHNWKFPYAPNWNFTVMQILAYGFVVYVIVGTWLLYYSVVD